LHVCKKVCFKGWISGLSVIDIFLHKLLVDPWSCTKTHLEFLVAYDLVTINFINWQFQIMWWLFDFMFLINLLNRWKLGRMELVFRLFQGVRHRKSLQNPGLRQPLSLWRRSSVPGGFRPDGSLHHQAVSGRCLFYFILFYYFYPRTQKATHECSFNNDRKLYCLSCTKGILNLIFSHNNKILDILYHFCDFCKSKFRCIP
jgi:hypothetical protein